MFSKTCEYAIRAMIYIAQQSKKQQKSGIKEIALAINSPESFMAKIMQNLTRNGLVQSSKGPNGGFYLEKHHLQCSLADIVKIVDGDQLFSGCGLGLNQCSELQPCPIHNEFKNVRKTIYKMLQKAKLSEFSEEMEKSLTFLKRN